MKKGLIVIIICFSCVSCQKDNEVKSSKEVPHEINNLMIIDDLNSKDVSMKLAAEAFLEINSGDLTRKNYLQFLLDMSKAESAKYNKRYKDWLHQSSYEKPQIRKAKKQGKAKE